MANEPGMDNGAAAGEQVVDLDVAKRVAALRELSERDAVPAIQEVVQLCATSAEISLARWSPYAFPLLKGAAPLRLRFEACPEAPVPEAAVVLGASCAAFHSELWRRRQVVELGCGAGFVGVVLAALGSHVTLTDLPDVELAALNSIALNSRAIGRAGSAGFSALEWGMPREDLLAAGARFLTTASLVVAADPVKDEESMQNFVAVLQAMFGLEGEPLCPSLEGVLVAHKHRPNFCIGGYVAPAPEAKPSIVGTQECQRCLFHRRLTDVGLRVSRADWLRPPAEFAHPFVECWEIGRG